MSDHVLAFAEGPWAWFTSGPLDDIRGDDWDDVPRSGNAGEPRPWRPDLGVERYELIKVAFDGPFDPAPDWQPAADINAARRPWLLPSSGAPGRAASIRAGVSLAAFVELVRFAGGDVYMKVVTP